MKGDPTALRCKFETWKVRKPGNLLMRELPGTFEVEIRPQYTGKKFRLQAVLLPSFQQIGLETFPESKLKECMEYVQNQFKTMLGEWEEVK
jgi:hypothetical protein